MKILAASLRVDTKTNVTPPNSPLSKWNKSNPYQSAVLSKQNLTERCRTTHAVCSSMVQTVNSISDNRISESDIRISSSLGTNVAQRLKHEMATCKLQLKKQGYLIFEVQIIFSYFFNDSLNSSY